MTDYYLGIDNGGTLSKAVIFDEKGRQIAYSSKSQKVTKPQAGFTERDMNELWEINCNIIKEAIDKSNINSNDIKAISCTGHGKGLYLWGEDNKPCYKGIVSTDTRAHEYPKKWKEDKTADRVFEKTYQDILSCQPVSLLNWLKDNKPDIIPKIKWIFEVKDYIRFMLTKEAYAEITDYSGSNLMNIKDRCFDGDLLKEFDLEHLYDKLPPLKKSTDICGHVTKEVSKKTGLKEGIPVAGGMFDIDACAIAMDITNEENIAVIAGTWSINEYLSKKPVLNKSIMMNSLYCIDGYYLIEECSPTSAGNNAWFMDIFGKDEKIEAQKMGKNVYEYCDELAATLEPDESDIIFLPYIYGSNYNAKAKACFVGLDSHHEKRHVIRAVLEGIVFAHKVHLDKLMKNRNRPSSVRLGGGGANSLFWAQMFADVFDIPIEIIDTSELGALGCAMSAAVVAGKYKTLKEAAKNMTHIKTKIKPNSDYTSIYKKKFDRFKKVSELLDSVWD